jgi:galactokinase
MSIPRAGLRPRADQSWHRPVLHFVSTCHLDKNQEEKMTDSIRVSTPSRLCLFGEHQDYLGLEVIAVAVDLRFYATVRKRDDQMIHIAIRDRRLDRLDSTRRPQEYEQVTINLKQPIIYENNRDYLRSSIRILQKNGYPLKGFDVQLDSEIPIGKGMCSSSTLVVVLIKAMLERINHPDKEDPRRIAELAFHAEVTEFSEPGGRMDHYTSAIGGMVHLDFSDDFHIHSLNKTLSGVFILFDSLEQKNTTHVLASAKEPTQAALKELEPLGIHSVRDFFDTDGSMQPNKKAVLDTLEPVRKRKLLANIENHAILKRGLALFEQEPIDNAALGHLLSAHHAHLRDGLDLSTPAIERILDTALKQGALGGKINGSGGGGCCFVYAEPARAEAIIEAVQALGYPARRLRQDTGVRKEPS